MDQATRVHIEALEAHIAKIEGILHVILEELSKGTIQESASEIKEILENIDLDNGND